MKRALATLLVLAGCWGLLHWPVHTRQGVDYQLVERTIPLYVKLGRFLYRDLEYRVLVREITRGIAGEEGKALALYDWVRTHVHHGIPKGMPVVDDHVWHIIVRGYGTPDQLADVLATLCAYGGLPADVVGLGPPGRRPVHAVTMVRIGGAWHPLDPYYGVVVRSGPQRVASREEILANLQLVRAAAPALAVDGIDYAQLYQWLPAMKPNADLRPYRHQPLLRAWYELRRLWHQERVL